MHYRQEQLINQELSKYSSITHKYQGKQFTVNRDNIDDFDKSFLQSLSTRLAKEYPKSKSNRKVKSKGQTKKGDGFDKTTDSRTMMQTLVRQELYRLSTAECIVEEKLDYPKVFQKLITEPHLALEQFKQTREYYKDLYLFVDESVGYNSEDKGFHHTLYSEAKKIKGIKTFNSSMLRFNDEYYIVQLKKLVPPGKKIIVFTQGCGGSYGEIPSGYHIHFVTHFHKGDTCGCNTIPHHEDLGQRTKRVTMHYGIDTAEKLRKLLI